MVVILAILAVAVVQTVATGSEDARTATAKSTLRSLQSAVNRYHAIHGVFPETIDGAWFSGGQVPLNPVAPYTVAGEAVECKSCGHDHVAPKLELDKVDNGELAGWWYKVESGIVRARVSSHYVSDPATAFVELNGVAPE